MTAVSLSDLKAKRAAMQYDGSTELLIENAIANRNATGIVATHNAADVLIEIAETALAYQAAKEDSPEERKAIRSMFAALAKIKP